MTKSTPDDLAVAFRSLARRQAEALGETDITPAVEHALGELQRHVADAARIVGVRPDANVVADAIDERPAHAWTVEALDALREVALDAGATLRRLASIAGADEE